MIRFEDGNPCFSYRVAGVVVRDGAVLLQQAGGDEFWVLPGGRPEFGETAEQALKREMREELDAEVEIVRLLWFVENFFTYAGKGWHELTLYFLMLLPADCKYLVQPGPFRIEEAGTKFIFQWFSREPEILSSLPLLPSFLRQALQNLPETLQHVVHVDG